MNKRIITDVEIGILSRQIRLSDRYITELKNVQVELEYAVDVANLANQSKTDFLANMSHELHNGKISLCN